MGEATTGTQTRVDFYVLGDDDPDARFLFACRLAEKAWNLDTGVYAHAGTPEAARRLDDLLWTFRQGSFVPHEVLQGAPPAAPIAIGTDEHRLESGELLINLTGAVPAFAEQFARVAEIVTGDAADRQAGRERFRQYRERGLEPETHRIGG